MSKKEHKNVNHVDNKLMRGVFKSVPALMKCKSNLFGADAEIGKKESAINLNPCASYNKKSGKKFWILKKERKIVSAPSLEFLQIAIKRLCRGLKFIGHCACYLPGSYGVYAVVVVYQIIKGIGEVRQFYQ